jgi:Flp pilus assembly protein TadG
LQIGSCGGPANGCDASRMLRTLTKYLDRRREILARFCAAQTGATVVEFALIAPAFLAVIFAILQTTLFLFAQQTLQNAAVQAGRMFMTGAAQTSGLTQAGFNSDVCPLVSALFNCNNLQINVAAYSSFSSASTAPPSLYNSSGQIQTTGTYSTGSPGTIMVVQLAYPWPIIGLPIGSLLPTTGYGTTEMMGVTAFRVEPY